MIAEKNINKIIKNHRKLKSPAKYKGKMLFFEVCSEVRALFLNGSFDFQDA